VQIFGIVFKFKVFVVKWRGIKRHVFRVYNVGELFLLFTGIYYIYFWLYPMQLYAMLLIGRCD